MRAIANTHRVAKSVWSKWTRCGQQTFNEVFESMRNDPDLFLHPKQDRPNPKHWGTTAWNAAWLAAYTIKDIEQTENKT